MPFIILLIAILVVVIVSLLILPWTIIQRYRTGTARRRPRAWLALVNVIGIGFSAAIFVASAAICGVWIPGAFTHGVSGLAAGCALGLIGLWLTSWETTSDGLHYTPNRWLVLALTLAVGLRLCFGLWRGWQVWRTNPSNESWLAASGFTGSLAVGALVLGYYFVFWAGICIYAKSDRASRRR